MAQTQVYTCDICKQSKSKDDLARLTVQAEGIRMKGVGYGGIKIDICPDCLRKKGFVVEVKPTEEEQEIDRIKNAKTLEDKIVEILDDLGVVWQE